MNNVVLRNQDLKILKSIAKYGINVTLSYCINHPDLAGFTESELTEFCYRTEISEELKEAEKQL